MSSFGDISTQLHDTTRAPLPSAVARNGSSPPAASTSPFLRAAGSPGDGTSPKSTPELSLPSCSIAYLTVVSPMFFRLFTETFAPSRSAGVLIGESSGTTTALKSFFASPVVDTPLTTNWRSRPCSAATMSDTTLPNAKSKSPLTTPGTAAAPPLVVSIERSMPSSSKKPLSSPSQMGAVSTIGMTPTLRSTSPSEPASFPSVSPPHALVASKAAQTATAANLVRLMEDPSFRAVGSVRVRRWLAPDGHPSGFGEGVDVGFRAAVARPGAGLADTAERCVGFVVHGLVVDVRDARRDAFCELEAPHDVTGDDAEREPVVAGRRERDRLGVTAERYDGRDRAEDLLGVGRRIGRRVGEHRRAVVQGVVLATRMELGTSALTVDDLGVDRVALGHVDHRPQGDVIRCGVADRERVGLVREALHVLVVEALVHEVSSDGHADLALVEVRAPCGQVHCLVDVGVGEHDVRGVASQLEVGTGQVASGELTHLAADRGRAGERDDAYVGVGHERLADVGTPGQHLQQSGRQPGLGEDARDRDSAGHRRTRVGFED